MKYDEAIKLIKGLSKKYSINNDDEPIFELIYKSKPIAWVDKLEQFNFGRVNISASGFNELPYSHKLWTILSELAMTPLDKRKVEHKWNVIVGNDGDSIFPFLVWAKNIDKNTIKFRLKIGGTQELEYVSCIFTDSEFSDLIKYIKTLPEGEWQAKVAEHGKTEIKNEDSEEKI